MHRISIETRKILRTLLLLRATPTCCLSVLSQGIISRIIDYSCLQVTLCEAANTMLLVSGCVLSNGRYLEACDVKRIFAHSMSGNCEPKKMMLNLHNDAPQLWRVVLSASLLLHRPGLNTLWNEGIIYGLLHDKEVVVTLRQVDHCGCGVIFVGVYPNTQHLVSLLLALYRPDRSITLHELQRGVFSNNDLAKWLLAFGDLTALLKKNSALPVRKEDALSCVA
eukprot:TRINITY_DN4510_c0_g2_i2.p1 TRINITY_DN4510_c0_g2~~TRINITY_DN4510_c0_g2_i2.p1  ORF type:complete len:223 (+),score=16.81 TRINITY_DN4510_c0_g2_i2:208-876(+)